MSGDVALAFGAGLLAAVNPCGFALLPAYLSLLIMGEEAASRPVLVARALRLSFAMTLGFATLFAAFGVLVAPFAPQVQEHLPWFTVVLGLGLLGTGSWLLAGRSVRVPPLFGRGRRRARPLTAGTWSMFGFGVSYATASLTCTIAPFLAVVAAAFRAGSIAEGSALFLVYALGMGAVVGTVAMAVALARDGVIRRLRSSSRWVPRVAGAVVALAGAYVAYYGAWELRSLNGDVGEDPAISAAGTLQRALADLVQAVPGWLWLLPVVAVVGWLVRARRRRSSPAGESVEGKV